MSLRQQAFRGVALVAIFAGLVSGAPTVAAAQDAAESRKSPALALALSLVVPGGGQVYNGHYAKGAVMFGGTALSAGSILLTVADLLELDDDRSGTRVHIVGAVGMGLILWSWIDAPLSATAINRRMAAGSVSLSIGAHIHTTPSGRGAGVSLLRVEF